MTAKLLTSLGLLLDIIGIWITFKDRVPDLLLFKQRNVLSTRNSLLRLVDDDKARIADNDDAQLRAFGPLYLFRVNLPRWIIRVSHLLQDLSARWFLKVEGVVVPSLLNDDGYLDVQKIEDAFAAAVAENSFCEEEYEPWEPPLLGLRLILLGFIVQLCAVWF